MQVSDAVRERCSTRAFLNDPVPLEIVHDLLDKAGRAPSGGNIQPWRVHVLTGATLQQVASAALEQFDLNPEGDSYEHTTYPEVLLDPYRSHRREVGLQLYESVGVGRGDREEKLKYLRRNFEFFGAPVGMIFAVEKLMVPIQWTDLGMYLQTIVLLATECGLGTCAQGAWSMFPRPVKDLLGITEDEILVCGLALGYADTSASINGFRTNRAGLDETVTFHE